MYVCGTLVEIKLSYIPKVDISSPLNRYLLFGFLYIEKICSNKQVSMNRIEVTIKMILHSIFAHLIAILSLCVLWGKSS